MASGLKATIRLPCHAGPQGVKRYKRFCWSTWRGLAGEGNTNCVRPGVHTRIGDPDFFILGVDRQQRGMTSYSHAAAPHVFRTTPRINKSGSAISQGLVSSLQAVSSDLVAVPQSLKTCGCLEKGPEGFFRGSLKRNAHFPVRMQIVRSS